ncbi:MAG: hypothetical protein ABR551_00755 [Gemmatimonadales bacterium]
MKGAWLPAWAILVGCGAPPLPEEAPSRPNEAAAVHAPEDSLAFRTASGTEIWFVSGRMARDAAGRECLERLLEIRDSAGRRGVPLLYTLETPATLDDTSIEARISNRCEPGERYRISLRTGRPTPLRTR